MKKLCNEELVFKPHAVQTLTFPFGYIDRIIRTDRKVNDIL